MTMPDVRPEGLPEVVRRAEGLAAGVPDCDVEEGMAFVLRGLRQQLGLDVAFVGRFEHGRRVLAALDSDLDAGLVHVGMSQPLEATYCARVVDGRLPEYVRDARAQPAVQTLPVTRSLPVGTHLSVPIVFSDGHVYGTLCGFTFVPDPELRPRDLGVMRLLARLLGRHLERLASPVTVLRRTRAEVAGVISDGGPDVVLQPVIDLDAMTVVGYEALSRFPDGEPPDTWFARAATAGLGVALEIAAVRRALGLLADLPPGQHLAVNVSAETLCSPHLLRAVSVVDLSRVVLELTEQTGVTDYEAMRSRVQQLRRHGARLAVDDAGAGHAGLQRIIELVPDVIKLDRSMVHDIGRDQPRQAMVSALALFAARTGAVLVAEGVEHEEEVLVLRELGVQLGQGYHLGVPTSP